MRGQAFNPYLPQNEYIPDAEPYVFGNRVYIYGSHDRFGAPMFCMNDYVCYSAPVDDLSDWRYEGIIYHKNQDQKQTGNEAFVCTRCCKGARWKSIICIMHLISWESWELR